MLTHPLFDKRRACAYGQSESVKRFTKFAVPRRDHDQNYNYSSMIIIWASLFREAQLNTADCCAHHLRF